MGGVSPCSLSTSNCGAPVLAGLETDHTCNRQCWQNKKKKPKELRIFHGYEIMFDYKYAYIIATPFNAGLTFMGPHATQHPHRPPGSILPHAASSLAVVVLLVALGSVYAFLLLCLVSFLYFFEFLRGVKEGAVYSNALADAWRRRRIIFYHL